LVEESKFPKVSKKFSIFPSSSSAVFISTIKSTTERGERRERKERALVLNGSRIGKRDREARSRGEACRGRKKGSCRCDQEEEYSTCPKRRN
jgi:hypothetical protein